MKPKIVIQTQKSNQDEWPLSVFLEDVVYLREASGKTLCGISDGDDRHALQFEIDRSLNVVEREIFDQLKEHLNYHLISTSKFIRMFALRIAKGEFK